MRCHDVEILLSARRDLNMSQRAEVEHHLAGCRACAAARRVEDRTTQLLALLPNPDVAAPPRVAAAIRRLSARQVAASRLRHTALLSAGVGAAALVVAVLVNILSGGALLSPAPTAETAARPAAPVAARPADTLYLIHEPAPGGQRLLAWEPDSDRVRFTAALGAPTYGMSDPFFSNLAAGPDVAFSPDGGTIYMVHTSADAVDLVAYSTADGGLRWRRELGRLQPLLFQIGQGRLSVAPDGSRVFLRLVTIDPARRDEALFTHSLLAFDSATGQEAGAATAIADAYLILPLSADRLVIATRMQELGLISLAENGPPERWINATVAAAALLPDGKTIYALGPDLTLLIVDVQPDGLHLRETIDLVEPGGFFFEHAAIAPDGQTIAVGQTTRNAAGLVSSEVRIYRTADLQLAPPDRRSNAADRLLYRRQRFERPLTGLAVSPDGLRVYATLGPSARPAAEGQPPLSGPSDPTRAALVTIAIGEPPGSEAATVLDPQIVGVAAAR